MSKRDQIGFFYAAQLYPDVMPLVVKFGFTMNPQARITSHRAERYAPAAEMLQTWPAVRMWERFIIRHVTAKCRQVMDTEVFLVDGTDAVVSRVNAFTSSHDVTCIATPPYIPFNDTSGRLISINQAHWCYGIPNDKLLSLIETGILRSYPFRAVLHHAGPCIEEEQIEAWLVANKGTFVAERPEYAPGR